MLDYYITLGWNGLSGINALAYLGPFVNCKDSEQL
jgi:hypothetical protein